jgi:hypothetical protein
MASPCFCINFKLRDVAMNGFHQSSWYGNCFISNIVIWNEKPVCSWLGFCYLHCSFGNWDSFEIIHLCFSCHKLNGYFKRPENLFVMYGCLILGIDSNQVPYFTNLLSVERLAERWEEWQHVEVSRRQEYERLQRRFDWGEDSVYNQDAIELSGGRWGNG